MNAPSIACTLTGSDFKEQLAWIARLNRRSLKTTERDDLRLTLSYDRRALKQVSEMVERERACCAFLSFEIETGTAGVKLSITAPEEAREAADEAFKPFISSASNAGCSCCGSAA